MPRSRSLPVTLILFLLVGVDALWTMRTAQSAYIPEPIVIHHSVQGGAQTYQGDVALPLCGQLRSGISSGAEGGIYVNLSVEKGSGPCSDIPQAFSLGTTGSTTLRGVTINGAPASFRVIEDN